MSYDGTLKFDTKIDTNTFNAGVSKIGNLAKAGLGLAVKTIGAAATGMGALGAASYKAGSAWEAGMSEVAAISGATGDELENLKNVGLDVAKTSKFTASDVAEAYKYMGMAGWDAAQMTDALAGVMDLAAASGEELGTVSDIVTDGLTAFGLEAKDAGRFADVLAAAATSSNTNVGMMGETFKYAAPLIGSLYGSGERAMEGMEDAAVAIGLMANSGIKASQAGTTLRSILTRLSNNEKAQAAFEELGTSLYDAEGHTRDLSEVLDEARVGWANLTESEKAQAASTIAGTYAMSGFQAIMNATPESINSLTDAIKGADGAASSMADKMLDNLPGAITKLSSTFDILKVSVYQNMQEPLKNAVLEAKGWLDQLQGAFDKGGFQGLVSEIGTVLAQVVEKVAECGPKILDAATSLIDNFGKGIMTALGNLKASGKINELVISAFNALTTTTEWIFKIGIELIGLLGQAIIDNAPRLKESASNMIHNIVQTISDNAESIAGGAAQLVLMLAGAISDNMPLIISTAVKLVAEFAKGLLSNPQALADAAPALITYFVGKFALGHPQLLAAGAKWVLNLAQGVLSNSGAFSGAISTLTNMVSGIGQAFSGIGGAISTAFSGIAEVIGPVITTIGGIAGVIGGAILAVKNFVDMWQNGWNAISTILEALGLAIAAVGAVILGAPAAVAAVVAGIIFAVSQLAIAIHDHWDEICEFFKGIGTAIADWWEDVKKSVGEKIKAIGEFFGGLKESIATHLGNAIQAVVTWAQNLWTAMTTAVSNAINGALEFFRSLGENIFTHLSNAINSVITWGVNLLEAMGTAVSTAIDNALTFFSGLPGRIMEFLSNVIATIAEWGTGLLETLSTAVSTAIDAAVTFFSELPGKIVSFFSEIIEHVIQWGKDMLEKMGEAAKNAIDKVVGFFKEMPGKLWEWFKQTIDKAIEWGKQMVKEMGDRAKEAFDKVINWFKQLPGKIKEFFDDIIKKAIEWGKNLIKEVGDAAKNAIDAAIKFFSEFPGKVWEFLCDIIDKVVEWGGNLLSSITEAVTSAVEAGIELFKQFVEDVAAKLKEIIDKVIQWGKDLIENGSKAIKDFVDKILKGLKELVEHFGQKFREIIDKAKEFVTSLAKKGADAAVEFGKAIINGFKDIVNKVWSVGKDIVTGIWNGLKEGWSWLVDKVGGLAGELVQKIKDFLKIGSPSKVMADEVGRWLPPGIGDGFADAMPALSAQIGGYLDDLKEDISTNFRIDATDLLDDMSISDILDFEESVNNAVAKSRQEARNSLEKEYADINEKYKGEIEALNSEKEKGRANLATKQERLEKQKPGMSDEKYQAALKEMESQREKFEAAMAVKQSALDEKINASKKVVEDQQNEKTLQILADKMASVVKGEAANVSSAAKDKQCCCNCKGDTYYDQHVEQTNEYHVPVPTASEVAKEQREQVRKLAFAGG